MHMSPAALPPVQPHISAADREHPLFALYMQHRSFCSNNLIQASAFDDWLYQYNRDLESTAQRSRPEYPAFIEWMNANRGGARKCPAGLFPYNFQFWIEGGRW